MSDRNAWAPQTRRKSLFRNLKDLVFRKSDKPSGDLDAFDYSFQTDSLILRKSPSTGEYHLMTIYSNRFRDRDSTSFPRLGGEIVSSDGHRKYMAFLDANPGKAPELWSLHLPGTARKNRAHWWDFDGNFAYAEFKLTPEEALGVYQFAQVFEPGLSHGFAVYRYDAEKGIIEEYETYEISILPQEWAANPWTTFTLIRKELEDMKLTPEKRAVLVSLHGEEFVNEFEQKSDKLVTVLDALGVDTKSVFSEKDAAQTDATTEVPAATPAAPGATTSVTEEAIVGALNTLHQALSGEIKSVTAQFSKTVEELTARINKIESDDTDRVGAKAAAITPSILTAWMPASIIGQSGAAVFATDALHKKGPAETLHNSNHVLAGLLDGLGGENE